MRLILTFAFATLLAGCEKPPRQVPLGEGPSPHRPRHELGGEMDRISVGNGGEKIPWTDGGAWFLGNKPIRGCISLAPEFPLTAAEAKQSIESAALVWSRYLTDKKVNEFAPTGAGRENHTPQLSMNLKLSADCRGNEDLVFKLGVEDEQVQIDRNQFRNHPGAFAVRSAFDPKTGWGRGYVYLDASALESIGRSFRGVAFHGWILHELGHVLGCGHVPGTIMDRYIADTIERVAQRFDWATESLLRIDGEATELLLCPTCSMERHGTVPDLTKRSDGERHEVLLVAPNGLQAGAELRAAGAARSNKVIYLKELVPLSQVKLAEPVFKRAWSDKLGGNHVQEAFSYAITYLGRIYRDGYGSAPATVHWNADTHPGSTIQVLVHSTSGTESLFEGEPWLMEWIRLH